ncbi:HEAT repeat domain-containing protein [Leptolyngbya sp. FACHB-711]|uniref:HEAT repeat domain-containing protein n=1 Tax=unclassified Leptolyngbya TaxID=2650499 RepID=UPI001686FD50|nr:HEAT repeat domain-containing protein [Leptolyngbya sp. FACHB-711]MBD1850763.1 HEAT repeat domain-containing protein [Cyanobacteria bacterium FACHB-502]MBD2024101.1 HEAT repeat domain-containing protein [Leptolyngbya sp. FACHB-711]
MLESSIDRNNPSEPGGSPGDLTIEQAIANLTHPDLSLRYYAAWWLGKFRVKEPAAVDALVTALQDESDRTELGGYPLRRNAARALGKLDDRRAVPGLVACLSCEDFYVRESAAQSLGMLGDASAVPALLPLLQGGLEAAQPVPGRPHLAEPIEAVMEALGALAPGTPWQQEAIDFIQPFLAHSLGRVQYAAARAMYQLTDEAQYGDRLVAALSGSDINLRRAALSDLGAVGYLPAAEAIATAAAENSFKLFSLKGLLEHQVRSGAALSPDALKLMDLMDSLL